MLQFCQVSESCHISAMIPNNTAGPTKTIRPYNAAFTQQNQTPDFEPYREQRDWDRAAGLNATLDPLCRR